MTTPSEAPVGASDPSARVQLIPTPVASPGSCAICGKNEHPDGFVWPQLDFEFYGTLYFCADCGGDIARVLRFISPNEMVGLREHIAAQDLELNTLRQAVLGLESTVDGLVADAHRRSTTRADNIRNDHGRKPDRDVVSDPVDEPNAGPASEDAGEATPLPPEPQPGPSEQGPERRRDDVFDTSSADELLGL